MTQLSRDAKEGTTKNVLIAASFCHISHNYGLPVLFCFLFVLFCFVLFLPTAPINPFSPKGFTGTVVLEHLEGHSFFTPTLSGPPECAAVADGWDTLEK